jgi:hypothetical protein
MVGDSGDAPIKWGNIMATVIQKLATTANLIPGVSKYFDDLRSRMNDAGTAAEAYTLGLQELEDQERAMIVPRAEANLKIKEARLIYADETKSIEVRMNALKEAIDLENKTADAEVAHQQFVVLNLRNINEEKKKAGTLRDSDLKALEEAIAKEIDLRTESFGRQIRIAKTLATAKEELEKPEKDRQKAIHDQEILAEQEAEKFVNAELARMDKEAETKWNKEVEFQRQLFDANRAAGQAEYDARIAEAEALAEAELAIQQALVDSKINLAYSVSNLLGAVAGKNRGLQNAALIAEKALAIAEVVINTTKANAAIRAGAAVSAASIPGPGFLIRLAANMAAAQVPINLNRVAAALDIAAIIAATASSIKANNSASSGGGGSSAPTAISNSAPAQRTFAQSAGSSIFTQPQLSQPQLNAIPNQNLLTAADIANALKGLPAPVVTVEDINAKVKSVNKVAVRANI